MVNFTREPIIESVITPREGCKLVVRNTKGAGQEEYLVDALEVVSFGAAVFFRSLERPKNFLLPVSDYEVLEVRETRMVLKHMLEPEKKQKVEQKTDEEAPAPKEKRRERRRGRRRGRKEGAEEGMEGEEESAELPPAREEAPPPPPKAAPNREALYKMPPPPSALISETIGRYKEMLVAADEEEPQLVPPSVEAGEEEGSYEAPKGASLFSPASFLRKLTGREEDEE
ncbi:MAG: hypothetical protein AB7F31_06360 [Parachlamydiales bacterium]